MSNLPKAPINPINSASNTGLSYKDAGVDIDAGDALVERIKPLAKKTMREGVLAGIGGFGALFEIPKRYKEPVLVSGTDGVGTKLRLAFEWKKHDTVGQDLVAMSVNDILVQGAESLFFLDYFACGKLSVDDAATVVGGIAQGCEIAGCALIGGETAEMPGMYPDGEYDLAGFAVGVVEKSKIITGKTIQPGDQLIGIASSGAHSNGYSLIRKIIERSGIKPSDEFDGQVFRDVVMKPTQIYVKPVLKLLGKFSIKGMAHITGGGLVENIPRVLPDSTQAVLKRDAWKMPHLFQWLQKQGQVADDEMHRVFNCGIGLVLVVSPELTKAIISSLKEDDLDAWVIGDIVQRPHGVHQTIVI
ncbi:MAG: phosphoribosylformylglycinamidine cyclo-ligase [Betaproteobacteria bacterium]